VVLWGLLSQVQAVSDHELCELWPAEALPLVLELQRRCHRVLGINVFALELGNTAITPSESGYVVPPCRERMSRHLEHARRPQTCPLPTVPSYSEKRFADHMGARKPLGNELRYCPVPVGEVQQQTELRYSLAPVGEVPKTTTCSTMSESSRRGSVSKLREVRAGRLEPGLPSTAAVTRSGERSIRTAPGAAGRGPNLKQASASDSSVLWNFDYLISSLGLKESQLRVGSPVI
jgi:hypothetical protein